MDDESDARNGARWNHRRVDRDTGAHSIALSGASSQARASMIMVSSTPFRLSAAEPERQIKTWSMPMRRILSDDGVRLDANHFDPEIDAEIDRLQATGFELRRLEDLATLTLPKKFTRVWADDSKHGIPYLNATDLLGLFSLGMSSNPRYLSRVSDVDIESLVVREGWLLITCSGTIGRVFYVPRRLDGWVATHDLIRVVPKRPGLAGYLFLWCSGPSAQRQILGHTHGGQIDHVTDVQVAHTLVQLRPDNEIEAINQTVLRALEGREMALETLAEAGRRIV